MQQTKQSTRRPLLAMLALLLMFSLFPANAVLADSDSLNKIADRSEASFAAVTPEGANLEGVDLENALLEHGTKLEGDATVDLEEGISLEAKAAAATSCANLPRNTNGGISLPRCGPAGMQVIIGASMKANENVQVFQISSNNTQRLLGIAKASSSGFVTVYLNINTKARGEQKTRLRGMSSEKVVDTFYFAGSPVSKPSLLASPTTGKLTDVFLLASVGFNGNDTLRFAYAAPDKKIYPSRGTVRASVFGGYTFLMVPKSSLGSIAKAGKWTVGVGTYPDAKRVATIGLTFK